MRLHQGFAIHRHGDIVPIDALRRSLKLGEWSLLVGFASVIRITDMHQVDTRGICSCPVRTRALHKMIRGWWFGFFLCLFVCLFVSLFVCLFICLHFFAQQTQHLQMSTPKCMDRLTRLQDAAVNPRASSIAAEGRSSSR